MKSRRIRWAGHVASMQEMRNACKILVGKEGGRVWSGFIWLRIGTIDGTL
jgi:hypothetical protein